MRNILKRRIVVIGFVLLIATIFLFTMLWGNRAFSAKSISQIIFHLKAPTSGGDTGVYFNWAISCLPYSFLVVVIYLYTCHFFIVSKEIDEHFLLTVYYRMLKCYLSVIVVFALFNYNIFGFVGKMTSEEIFYENHYVDPRSVELLFPEEQRNIIHIYLESIESTYSSYENGGSFDEDKIPELTSLAQENIHFSNTDLLGGSLSIDGTQWTIASMVAQSSGVPLTLPLDFVDYDYKVLLSGAYTLGEVLQERGYNQVLMKGSDASFGLTANYYYQSNHEIIDFNKMKELGLIPEDYKVFWGVEDAKVFEFAKDKIIDLSLEDAPFHFEVVTVDPHAPDGYLCETCQSESDNQYDNVLACQSKQVFEFIAWIQDQDFYEQTTIIINGDHLNMSSEYFEDVDKDYVRTPYNVILNSVVEANTTTNRLFSAMDWYPTILASVGVEIEGDRLGLGTNLFSDKKTWIEEYGFDYVDVQLQAMSEFYNYNLLENIKKDE